MSNLYSDRRGKALLAASTAVGGPGASLVIWNLGGWGPDWASGLGPDWAVPLLFTASMINLANGHLHDQQHRQRGEPPHATWGNPFRG